MEQKRHGFTIIELMTVMSIIIVLIGLLVPGLSALRRFAKAVAQRNQFYAIGLGLETFNAEWEGYPRSNTGYSGATQLGQAMVGEDLRGYSIADDYSDFSLGSRRFYLPSVEAHKLEYMYEGFEKGDVNQPFLCDEYAINDGGGMPVLYFRANASAVVLDDIYDYTDNQVLVELGKPWAAGAPHLLDETRFYEQIEDKQIGLPQTPYRMDSFILMSAGADGDYGTEDDVFNF